MGEQQQWVQQEVVEQPEVQQQEVQQQEVPFLLWSLLRLAGLQRESVDPVALHAAVDQALAKPGGDERALLKGLAQSMQFKRPRFMAQPDPAAMPVLARQPGGQWLVIRGRNGKGEWVADVLNAQTRQWQEQLVALDASWLLARMSLALPLSLSDSPVLQNVLHALRGHRLQITEAMLAGAMMSVLALVTSLYSMQVYDRVIPTNGYQTLLVLTMGVLMAVLFEFVLKKVRSHVYDRIVDDVDAQLARTVFSRFLSVRLDQLPQSVGSLAGQLRGYESVRSFLVSLFTQYLVDAPFALLFLLVLAAIAGWIALIPLVFLCVSIGVGLYYKGRVQKLSAQGQTLSNMKIGLLVETVEAAEIIKSGQGGWRMLERWLQSTDESRGVDLALRKVNEHSMQLMGLLQQVSYVAILASGALMVSRGEMSFGALIASSILSGRILSPVTGLTTQLVQWAHAKTALQGLDAIWRLQTDHGDEQPVVVDAVRGDFRCEGAEVSMGGKPVLNLANLSIRAGEKVGVIGTVGAGKTTLLRTLSGMYKPFKGRVLLDDIDMAHLSKPLLAENMGYLPQDGRLVGGTLRDNLLLGLVDPGDAAVLAAARASGLQQAVVAVHPLGLAQPIPEGGGGLSGGQRQLINLTRVMLRKPKIWLLDEPTSALDRALEVQTIDMLRQSVKPEDTLILVTHKMEMLSLVERLLVVAEGRVVMDGPRDEVLAQLKAR